MFFCYLGLFPKVPWVLPLIYVQFLQVSISCEGMLKAHEALKHNFFHCRNLKMRVHRFTLGLTLAGPYHQARAVILGVPAGQPAFLPSLDSFPLFSCRAVTQTRELNQTQRQSLVQKPEGWEGVLTGRGEGTHLTWSTSGVELACNFDTRILTMFSRNPRLIWVREAII